MEAALLAVVEEGHPFGDQDGLAVAVHQALAQQAGEVQGAAEAPPPAGGGGEAERSATAPGPTRADQ